MKKSMIIACCLLLLAGCKEKQQTVEVVKTIKADTVRVYGLAGSIQFPGKVTAPSDINLAFRVSDPIGNVYARVGAHVKKGELLARIDPRDYELQLAATEAEYNRIKAEVDRVTELYEKGSVTPNDRYKAGMETLSSLLEAQVMWQQAYTELVRASSSARVAETRYLKAAGRL